MRHKDKVTSIDVTSDLVDEGMSAYTIHYADDNLHAGCSIEAYTENGTTYIHQTIYKTEFYKEVYMSRLVVNSLDFQDGGQVTSDVTLVSRALPTRYPDERD